MSEILTVPVGLGDRSYDVLVGPGALDAALERLPAFFPRGRAILVTDRTVAEQHLGPVSEKLGSIGLKTQPILVEPGETAKSWDGLRHVVDALLDLNVERSECVIALGGAAWSAT